MTTVLDERWSRRKLFKVAGGLMLFSIADLRSSRSKAVAMTRMRWVERGVFPASGMYQSPVFEAEQTYNSIEVIWRADEPAGSAVQFHVRSSENGHEWTEWIHLHRDHHVDSLEEERTFAAPILIAAGNSVQYRVEFVPNAEGALPTLHEVEIGCVDTSPPAQFLNTSGSDDLIDTSESDDLIDGWIISRAGWGADESLRSGTPRYAPIQKVIIHHTVTQNNAPDPAAAMRAIYYYHTVTQDWGDIGYNYLIDWQGNVYEGRYGEPEEGQGVVGAHAIQYNPGSLGVALIGNFETVDPPRVALDSLVRLINSKAPNVDPAGIGPFVDRTNLPNICGHQDVLSTECPGSRVYERIPHIRGWCKGTGPIYLGDAQLRPASPRLVSFNVSPTSLAAGSVIRIDAVVENTGGGTMFTQGPQPGYIYSEGESFETTGFEKIEGMYRIGVDFDGSESLPNPFRWGLPGPLAAGERATITGFIRLTSVRTYNITASLIHEFMRYHEQGAFPHTVETTPPPTSPAAHSGDASMHYFGVTQHNVPAIFYSYWEANGGLNRFGYPLTEPFYEMSETDGQTYLMQYFERARFEHHPENAGTPYEVLLGLLARERTEGRENEAPFRRLDPLPRSRDYDYYPETGHTLRAGFREYWREYGGLSTFGYPITEEFDEISQTDGKIHIVQYFERARIEWHPEFQGTEYEFLLGHLAREALIDRGWLAQDF